MADPESVNAAGLRTKVVWGLDRHRHTLTYFTSTVVLPSCSQVANVSLVSLAVSSDIVFVADIGQFITPQSVIQ